MDVIPIFQNTTQAVELERIRQIQRRADDVLDQSRLLQIHDPKSFHHAIGFLKDIKAIHDEIDETFDPIIRAQHEAHKKSLEAKRKYSLPLEKAERIVKEKVGSYHEEQDRLRKEEEARLQHEAKKAEEQRRMRMAAEAAKAGDRNLAESILSDPVLTPVISLPSQTDGDGISYREVWKFRIVNSDLIPNKYKIVDERKIGAVVRALKDNANIPGVEVYCDKTVSVRRV